ncbi:MAG: hypothetical protein AABW51_04840 [Nanoarchaeota archaeon]
MGEENLSTQPVSTYLPKSNTEDVPQKKNVFLAFILTVITLCVYTPLWYLKRTRQFYNLGTTKRLVRILPSLLLFFQIILIVCVVAFVTTLSSSMGTFFQNVTTLQAALLFLILVSAIITFLLTIITAFYSRTIMNQALENKGVKKKLSIFHTLIFGHLYLQYEINRIMNDNEEKPRIAPLVVLLLILLAVGIGMYLLLK